MQSSVCHQAPFSPAKVRSNVVNSFKPARAESILGTGYASLWVTELSFR